jgi:REP element-mobilizing transposase RayT
MPRRPRVVIEGGVYHVYNRFARGAEVLREGDEAERLLDLLRMVRDRDGLTFFAWALMSNHFHLGVRIGPVPLARTMGFVQSRFGQGYNRRWRSSGPLWQSRYKARLVETEGDLQRLIAYIHLNPVTAGLVSDPMGYRYSGHSELMGKTDAGLIAVDEVLSVYGDRVGPARRAYVRALKGVRQAEWSEAAPEFLPWWRRDADRPLEPSPTPSWVDALGRTTGRERAPLSAQAFLVRACRQLGVTVARVAGGGQDREGSRLRYLVAALALERWGVGTTMLAREVCRRPEVVSRWAQRGAELRQTDLAFADAYDALDAALANETATLATSELEV